MKHIKNIFIFILCLISFSSCLIFSSCDFRPENNKKSIVCTIFPEYDWVREIIKGNENNFSLTCLTGNGEDMHSYQATVKDIAEIASADIFICVGGESDEWTQKALANSRNKNLRVINLLDILGDYVKEEEIKEGMQGEQEEGEADEHVWLSLENAKIFIQEIANEIVAIDGYNSALYLSNAQSYIDKLDELNNKFKSVVEAGSKNTLVFADRFPFRYFVDDYNLNYYAAFSGCSAESEASFETIIFLSNKVSSLNLNVILVIEGSKTNLAQTVRKNTTTKNQEILVFNSMQSVKLKGDSSYLSIMEQNLEILKKALA